MKRGTRDGAPAPPDAQTSGNGYGRGHSGTRPALAAAEALREVSGMGSLIAKRQEPVAEEARGSHNT